MAAALSDAQFRLLSQTILFRTLGPDGLLDAVNRPECVLHSYEKGNAIYTPHTFARSLGVLLSGSVEVTKEDWVVSVLREGDLFGAAALFNEEADYVTTLTARSPCQVVYFSQTLMAYLLEHYPSLSMAYVRYLSGRIRFLSDKLESLVARSADRRLEQYLLARLENGHVTLDCSASALARRLNMSRASLYRAFELLEHAGIIRREGKLIFLNDGAERNELP